MKKQVSKKAGNTTTTATNLSNVKGVSFVNNGKCLKCFRARITVNGQRYSLGYYESVEEAAKAYNKGAKKLLGEKIAKAQGKWNKL